MSTEKTDDKKVKELKPFDLKVQGFEQEFGTILFIKIYMSAIASCLVDKGLMVEDDFAAAIEKEMKVVIDHAEMVKAQMKKSGILTPEGGLVGPNGKIVDINKGRS